MPFASTLSLGASAPEPTLTEAHCAGRDDEHDGEGEGELDEKAGRHQESRCDGSPASPGSSTPVRAICRAHARRGRPRSRGCSRPRRTGARRGRAAAGGAAARIAVDAPAPRWVDPGAATFCSRQTTRSTTRRSPTRSASSRTECRGGGEQQSDRARDEDERDQERLQAPFTVHIAPDQLSRSFVRRSCWWRTAAEQHTDSTETNGLLRVRQRRTGKSTGSARSARGVPWDA